MNSRETKDIIRKAAEATKRWGSAGNHTVFLRDTIKRKRTSSNEDPRTPKKTKMDETPKSRPKREEGLLRRRLDDERSETKMEERARTGRAKLDTELARREKLENERLEARRAKLAHQDREDQETQEIINKQGQRARELDNNKKKVGQTPIIKTFRALNESASKNEEDDKNPATKEAEPQEESEDETENPGVAVREEDTDDGAGSEGSVELEFGSEIEKDNDKEYEYSEDNDEYDELSADPSPEREVFYKNSKNAARNKRRRKRRKNNTIKKRSPSPQELTKTMSR